MPKKLKMDPFEQDTEDNFEQLREPKDMKKMMGQVKKAASTHMQKKKLITM